MLTDNELRLLITNKLLDKQYDIKVISNWFSSSYSYIDYVDQIGETWKVYNHFCDDKTTRSGKPRRIINV